MNATIHTPPSDLLLLTLGSPDATLALVGGKGVSLARLVAAGLPIPPGFQITTEAYRRFADENQLTDTVLTAMAHGRADDPTTLDRASARIQLAIMRGTIPQNIAERIRTWYHDLGDDDPPSPCAPQPRRKTCLTGYLRGSRNRISTCGGDNLIHAVKRNWASL